MNHATVVVAGLLLTFTVSGVKAAEGGYPNRPIRFVVPFAPGGPSDILSRMVGQKLSESLGQTIVVDNRGSVGGVLGFELGAKSPPDGYTLLLAAFAGLTINPHVYKTLPYDPQRDFQPITQLTMGGNIVVVNPSVAAKSVKEFIALAKANRDSSITPRPAPAICLASRISSCWPASIWSPSRTREPDRL